MSEIRCKRIYEQPEGTDGFRVLVDRLWPRGIKREAAKIDLWAKEIAPSGDLRKRFGHVPERFAEFSARYRAELESNPDGAHFLDTIQSRLKEDNVTLLYGARDPIFNNAAVLKNWTEENLGA